MFGRHTSIPHPHEALSGRAAQVSKNAYQALLTRAGFRRITTDILPAPEFYYAEDYHQQYLAKNPRGYCGLGGTGISCPVGLVK